MKRMFTEEHRKNLSESHKGKKLSEETKEKIRIVVLSRKNGLTGRFKKGCIPWSKGKKLSAETKQKISETLKRKGIKPPHNPDKKLSDEHKRKIGLAGKGRKFSEERNKKISESLFGKYRGENSPNWKGGLTPEYKVIKDSLEYKAWRLKVFKRDNYTCKMCSLRSGNGKAVILHPHHIFNFAQYPELRLAINNGITFCEKCHREFHKKYGIKNNNYKQIELKFKEVAI